MAILYSHSKQQQLKHLKVKLKNLSLIRKRETEECAKYYLSKKNRKLNQPKSPSEIISNIKSIPINLYSIVQLLQVSPAGRPHALQRVGVFFLLIKLIEIVH